jgi:hypothetical protein
MDAQSDAPATLKLPAALRRDLVLLVAVKLIILTVLYEVFFSPSHHPHIDMAMHITGTFPQK